MPGQNEGTLLEKAARLVANGVGRPSFSRTGPPICSHNISCSKWTHTHNKCCRILLWVIDRSQMHYSNHRPAQQKWQTWWRLCIAKTAVPQHWLMKTVWARAMDDDDDFLLDMLSYRCPVTGKKRTAGRYDGHENIVEPMKRMKPLAIATVFILMHWYMGIYFSRNRFTFLWFGIPFGSAVNQVYAQLCPNITSAQVWWGNTPRDTQWDEWWTVHGLLHWQRERCCSRRC